MARYKRRKDGLYQANVQVGVDECSGKRKFKTIYARTIDELEIKKATTKKNVRNGIYSDDQGMTIEDWGYLWFELNHEIDGVHTKEMYNRILFSHIIPTIGNIRLQSLKKSNIQAMVNDRWQLARTCEQIVMTCKKMLDEAMEEGLLHKNVCTKISLPAYNRKEQRALTDLEKLAIFRAARVSRSLTLKQTIFLYLLQYCGLRRGETLALDTNSIDFEHNILRVRKAVTYAENSPVLKEPKTVAGIRDIPLPQSIVDCLKKYILTLGKNAFLFEMDKHPELMTKSSFRKFWNSIKHVLQQELPVGEALELTTRVFRYNYATMLYYAGVELKEDQRLLGHSKITITLEIYTALDTKQSNSAERLEEYLANVYDLYQEELAQFIS